MNHVVGRLAPSPTGAQHVGNARTFLWAWLSVRSRGGAVVLRMEDIDSPRVKAWAAAQAIEDLRWLGLDWDQGPDVGGPCGPYVQTARQPVYAELLDRLRRAERVYPCTCSRSDVAAAASAPHSGQEGPVYPGTCAGRSVAAAAHLPTAFAWRFRVSPVTRTFCDRVCGPQTCRMAAELGDFVIAKSDDSPAYQLAVVADDHAMGVTEVVRGNDLLPSTFRQWEIYDQLGWQPPEFAHVPLVVGPDGRRLAKRHGDTRLATLRANGVRAESLVGWLAFTCGLLDRPAAVRPQDLVSHFQWNRLPATPLIVRGDEWTAAR